MSGQMSGRAVGFEVPVVEERLKSSLQTKIATGASVVVAVLTGVASVGGLLYPEVVYPTAEMREAFLANDVMNLVIGLPILLGAMWMARRGSLVGLLFWPGALLYGLYNYLVYVMGMPLTVLFPVYMVIVAVSVYTVAALVAAIDGQAVQARLAGRVPERLAGGVLAGFGILFMLRTLAEMGGALAAGTAVAQTELALLVADFVVMPALLIGGVLLWRRRALGYVTGGGLLFLASMLFVGLIGLMLLQPVLVGVPVAVVDVVVVAVMGLVCFVPFGLFVRGMVGAR